MSLLSGRTASPWYLSPLLLLAMPAQATLHEDGTGAPAVVSAGGSRNRDVDGDYRREIRHCYRNGSRCAVSPCLHRDGGPIARDSWPSATRRMQ